MLFAAQTEMHMPPVGVETHAHNSWRGNTRTQQCVVRPPIEVVFLSQECATCGLLAFFFCACFCMCGGVGGLMCVCRGVC